MTVIKIPAWKSLCFSYFALFWIINGFTNIGGQHSVLRLTYKINESELQSNSNDHKCHAINQWLDQHLWSLSYSIYLLIPYRHSFCDAYSISGIISTTTNFTNGPNGQYLSKASTILRKAKKKKFITKNNFVQVKYSMRVNDQTKL